MLFDLDKWQEIGHTLAKNKLRTALTALGVFWGIFMLVLMLGFGSSLENGVKTNMVDFTSNGVFIWSRETSLPYKGLAPGRNIEFDNGDTDALRRIPGIDALAPRADLGGWRGGTQVVRDSRTGAFTISGDVPEYTQVQPMTLSQGRFINPLDLRERRKVAVLGNEVVKQLYDEDEDPIGTHIEVRGVYFQVVGTFTVLTGGHNGDRQANTIHVPLTTFQQAFNLGDEVGWFTFTVAPDGDAAEVERRAKAVLRERHTVSPEDNNAIGSFNTGKEFGKIQGVFVGINATIWVVGIFTLLAGVIGVSNIMLIAVKERTKEIGVRKALGATPSAIVNMVLREALILTAFAGYLGLVVGVGLLELVGSVLDKATASAGPAGGGDGGGGLGPAFAAPDISIQAALAATAVLIVAGVVAGIIPARHAARIRPIEALRAE